MLGFRLKELRQKKQLTQEQLAEMLGLATRTISSWEIGERKPTIETVIWLSRYYNVSSDYILELTDNPRGYDLTIREEKEPPTSEENERVEQAKNDGLSFRLPLDSLPKDPQELSRALEPILEPLVRKIVNQLAQNHEERE